MAVWVIGIVSICLGTLEQFLVNESRMMAAVVLIAGVMLLIGMKKKNISVCKWQRYTIFVITVLHVLGLVSDRWIVYTSLGVVTTFAGIVITVWALVKKNKKCWMSDWENCVFRGDYFGGRCRSGNYLCPESVFCRIQGRYSCIRK